jgi:hypothetical protein
MLSVNEMHNVKAYGEDMQVCLSTFSFNIPNNLTVSIKYGMKMAVFWVVAPCSLVEVYQRFRRPLRTHRCENLKSYLNLVWLKMLTIHNENV